MAMFWTIMVITLLLSVVLITMILLQPSKGGGIGAAFGGLGTSLGSTFGARRTLDFLQRWTTYLAIGLAALCMMANLFFIPNQGQQQVTPVTQGADAPTLPNAPAPILPQGGASAPPAAGEGTSPAETAPDAPAEEPAE